MSVCFSLGVVVAGGLELDGALVLCNALSKYEERREER